MGPIALSAIVIFSGLASIICLIVAYYTYETIRQAFSVANKPHEYSSLITHLDEKSVATLPGREEIGISELPIIGFTGRNGSVLAGGKVTRHESGIITRDVLSTFGTVQEGDQVYTDLFVYQRDPNTAFGTNFENIRFESELGNLDAWIIPRCSSRWVIFVHGHRSSRRESLRYSRIFSRLNISQMMITYRNDVGVERDTSGYHMFGLTEWRDLESAIEYVKSRGASTVILFGHSMGGAVVFKYLLATESNDLARYAILESPALDLNRIILNQARKLPFPATLALGPVKKLVSYLTGVRWEELNYVLKTSELQDNVLLIHSESDTIVPIEISDDLANHSPHRITYIRLKDGPHAGLWNLHRTQVERGITAFLESNILGITEQP